VLNDIDGVRDSAVVGVAQGAEERVHAVLLLEPATDADAVVRIANTRLQDHQKIRTSSTWPGPELPRTEGDTQAETRTDPQWVRDGAQAGDVAAGWRLRRSAARTLCARPRCHAATTIDELGLSSLERVELIGGQSRIGSRRASMNRGSPRRATVAALKQLIEEPTAADHAEDPVNFPRGTAPAVVSVVRRALAGDVDSAARTRVRVPQDLRRRAFEERPRAGHLRSNHQSHMDVP
jgi:hypothetical protein